MTSSTAAPARQLSSGNAAPGGCGHPGAASGWEGPRLTPHDQRVEASCPYCGNRLSGREWIDPAQRIVEVVARYARVSPAELLGESRMQHIARPRFLAMWLLRGLLGWSTVRTARLFSRDHAAVAYGLAETDRRLGGCRSPISVWADLIEFGEGAAR